jgi:hypothetical protein
VAGHQVVQHLAVRLQNPLGQQGGGGDHQHAAGLGRDLGQRLIQQDAEVAVSNPAGLEVLAVGVGAKLQHERAPWFRAPQHRQSGYPAAVVPSVASIVGARERDTTRINRMHP